MLQSSPTDRRSDFLCLYVNTTERIQVVRISNIPGWYFERVVFVGQRLLFEAKPEAQLEIYTHEMASAVLADRIDCQQLRVSEVEAPAPTRELVAA